MAKKKKTSKETLPTVTGTIHMTDQYGESTSTDISGNGITLVCLTSEDDRYTTQFVGHGMLNARVVLTAVLSGIIKTAGQEKAAKALAEAVFSVELGEGKVAQA